MGTDLLAAASWVCAAVPPGAAASPAELDACGVVWIPAHVPGTAAGALRDAGIPDALGRDYDSEDWWFRCSFEGRAAASDGEMSVEPGPWVLRLEGLATVADVWLNGRHLHHGEDMFVATRVEVGELVGENELAIRFAALAPVLAAKRPRPRWKTRLVRHQNLRWFRTSLLGRMPAWSDGAAPVGPWRPVHLGQVSPFDVVSRNLVATYAGGTGRLEVEVRLRGPIDPAAGAVLRVGEHAGRVGTRADGADVVISGSLDIAGAEPWWPHTHGSPKVYPVGLELDGHHVDLGQVGFRSLTVDRSDDGFRLVVNGVPVFCRGACWVPVDTVSLVPGEGAVREVLELLRTANLNMLRVTGTAVYEEESFFDVCDELGILVWHDCMFANMDPPEDETFLAAVDVELRQVFSGLQGRPCLAVVCGGSEVEQQASMFGVPPERRAMPLFEKAIPLLVAEMLPGVPYVTSSPSGGEPPFRVDVGVGHYFGVGAYLRPSDDVRREDVKFAAECLAFATPPERQTVEEVFGTASVAGHHPTWKKAVPRDVGMSWDFEDVRDHYVGRLFDVDPRELRSTDADRALDLGRAAVAELMSAVFTEWRRPGSACGGGLVLNARDLSPGPGWGLVDALGRPKAPWYALRRALSPVAVLLTDEGLNGLRIHLVNDAATALAGRLRVELFARGEVSVERGESDVEVPARSGAEIDVGTLFDGFRDVGYAYRFGPPSYDVVEVTVLGVGDGVVSRLVHLPLGLARAVEPDLGLAARFSANDDGVPAVRVTTRRLAQSVVVDVPGWIPDDSWFHLAPGAVHVVLLTPLHDGAQLRGEVRSLNSSTPVRIEPRDQR